MSIEVLTLPLVIGVFLAICFEGEYKQWRSMIGVSALILGITAFLVGFFLFPYEGNVQISGFSFAFLLVWVAASILMLLGMSLGSSDSRWTGLIALITLFTAVLRSHGQVTGSVYFAPVEVWLYSLWVESWVIIAVLEVFRGGRVSSKEETTEEEIDE